MKIRDKQIKFYIDILKDNEILLLKSCDTYFKSHYSSSPLSVLTGFLGSEGEAIIDKNGKITIFVDSRYHILVDKQVFEDVQIYKLEFGESFFDALKKLYKKNTIFYVYDDISLKTYMEFDEYFDLRKYELNKNFASNSDFNKKEQIFKVSAEIDKVGFLQKIEKLKKICSKYNKMLVFNLDEISYLTGLRSFQMKYSSNFRSVLYLDFKNSIYNLFCDNVSKKIKIEGLNIRNLEEFEGFASSINGEIALDINDVNLKNYVLIKNPIEIKNKPLSTLASIRSVAEIADLENAFQKLDKTIFDFKKKIKLGMSEYDLVQMFEEELSKNGAKFPSFKTILAIDENSASIHYSQPSKNKILTKECLLLLDCGGYWKNGFATDITRTFYFGANPKPVYKKIYTNVLKAFLACYNSNETNAKKIDSIARTFLKQFEKEGFYFAHGLGHGIGTSVHQNPPVLSMKSKDIIKPYQVHSIEPGLYGKDKDGVEFGVRIENCVYSDLNFKKISLSKFPFEEVLIDYSLLNKQEIELIQGWNS
ncbi:MAG: aminopeptidase P family protein [Candidatus Gastranaerophilales bacterium]|nr:aminopeptidase P family protein [Candidatus Gastranaerophilales bacterium]